MSSTVPIVLVFGHGGWIASYFIPLLENAGFVVRTTDARADDVVAVNIAIDINTPTHVLSLVGRTHGPGFSTIDYLEQPGKLVENIKDNLFSPVVLAHICKHRNIHFTYLGTGCIFSVDEPENSTPYGEYDDPDFFGSAYSTVKGFTDRIMRLMFDSTTLNVRIRMPITPDESPRNFITKIVKYEKVCSIANSMSVLPTLLPILCDMMLRKDVGTINMVNPGHISHNEILALYKEIVDPTFTWKNFTIEEQNEILLSKRSNNVLDTTTLAYYSSCPNIRDAVISTLQTIAASRE
jgi:3,5-epimerase/4-reductase